MSELRYIKIKNYRSVSGSDFPEIDLSYEIFGDESKLFTNGVLICHALTGNSNVAGEGGWWTDYIGYGKGLDLKHYTVIAFNIPGNGYGPSPQFFENYTEFTTRDIAILFNKGLEEIGVKRLHAILGGSLGGAIAWELAIEFPNLAKYILPIGSDYKVTDWVLAHNRVQMQILENSKDPLNDARMMAMMFYRTPKSFKMKFNRSWNFQQNVYNAESYLLHHGKKIKERFFLESYKLMNHLLTTHNISKYRGGEIEALKQVKAKVISIGIDSDIFFVAEENKMALPFLRSMGVDVEYREIQSPHGHDAFLIEFCQLGNLTADVFYKRNERDVELDATQKKKVIKFQ